MKDRPNYIVLAPAYDPDSGGGIFLHELVHALNCLGERALIWRADRPAPPKFSARVKSLLRKPSLMWKRPQWSAPFALNPDLNTPIAEPTDLQSDSIVVYPEVVPGNPLGARNVVRWLLYKPGLLHPYSFGSDEIFFRASEFCDLPDLTGGAPDLFLWKINPAYHNEGRTDRKGACFIVRKGDSKARVPETEDAIQIDGMSHADIAEVFNQCEVFYSYDEATFYSQYAAICGCLSVVVPALYSSRAEWVQNHPIGRCGVAYGLNDLDHARATMHLVKGDLEAEEAKGLATVRNFVDLTQKRFAPGVP